MPKIIFIDDRQEQFYCPRPIQKEAIPSFVQAFDAVFQNSEEPWEYEFYAYDLSRAHNITVCADIARPKKKLEEYNIEFAPCNQVGGAPVEKLYDVISNVDFGGACLFIDYQLWGVAQKKNDRPEDILQKILDRLQGNGDGKKADKAPAFIVVYSAVQPVDVQILCDKWKDKFQECGVPMDSAVLDRSDEWIARDLYEEVFYKTKKIITDKA